MFFAPWEQKPRYCESFLRALLLELVSNQSEQSCFQLAGVAERIGRTH